MASGDSHVQPHGDPRGLGRLVKPWPWGVREPCRQLPLLGTWVRINPLVTEALEGPLIPHHQELWTLPTGPLPAELGVKARRPRPRALSHLQVTVPRTREHVGLDLSLTSRKDGGHM